MIKNGKHILVFSGHMIDRTQSAASRFPNAMAERVFEAIDQIVSRFQFRSNELIGIAAAASGGDILFHEVCAKRNIHSEIYLPLPPILFKERSVSYAGEFWERRFDWLINSHEVHILKSFDSDEDNIFEKANRWMLREAQALSESNVDLIALWDMSKTNAKGGTYQMICEAKRSKIKTTILNIKII